MKTYLITVARSETRRVKVEVTTEVDNPSVSYLASQAIEEAKYVDFREQGTLDEVWYEAEYIKELE